jgi:hypothetical protein
VGFALSYSKEALMKRCAWLFLFVLLVSSMALGQIAKSDIERTIVDKDVVSKIMFGGKATPRGYSAPYPVNTLVNPETGQVTFRVEWGLMRAEVSPPEMLRRFDRGTSFHVANAEFKDDRLELKLDNPSGDSARLKLMLGPGWQKKLDLAAVQAALARIFVFGQQPQQAQPNLGSAHSPSVAASVPADPAPAKEKAASVPLPDTVAANQLRLTETQISALLGNEAAAEGKESRKNWIAEQNSSAARLAQVPALARGLGTCMYQPAGRWAAQLVVNCDDVGWMQFMNKLRKSREWANELSRVGFVTVHVNPYSRDGMQVDIAGTTAELLVTEGGLQNLTLTTLVKLPVSNSAEARVAFAGLYAGMAKEANCAVKLGGSQRDILLVECRGSNRKQLDNVFSEAALAPNLSRLGFTTLIYSDTVDTFTPATLSATGVQQLSSIPSKELLARYGLKSAEQLASEEQDARNYADYIEATVRKLLSYANAKRAERLSGQRWTSAEKAAFSRQMQEENAFITELRNSEYEQRQPFWPDVQKLADIYVGQGTTEGVPNGIWHHYVTTGSPTKDEAMRVALLSEVEFVKSKFLRGEKAKTAATPLSAENTRPRQSEAIVSPEQRRVVLAESFNNRTRGIKWGVAGEHNDVLTSYVKTQREVDDGTIAMLTAGSQLWRDVSAAGFRIHIHMGLDDQWRAGRVTPRIPVDATFSEGDQGLIQAAVTEMLRLRREKGD